MEDLLENLMEALANELDERITEMSEQHGLFRALESIPTNAGKIKYMEDLENRKTTIPIPENPRQLKCNQLAKQYREEGNKYFSSSRFAEALKCYNKSLCFAENNSEYVGLAYANRSAVYCELELYSRALCNIEMALEHNYPQKSIDKLKKREVKCKQKLKEGEIEASDEPTGVEFFKLSHEPNPRIPFIADCLKLRSNEQFGRNIITEKDLMPGDIVAIEEPFSKCLLLNFANYQFCANCLSDNCCDLLPCTDCTCTMFCSESCRATALKTFHEYECPVLHQLDKSARFAARTVFEALALYDGNIKNLMTATARAQNVTVFNFDFSGNDDEHNNRISMWKAVNSLSTNESRLSKVDLFKDYSMTAIVTRLFFKSTKLGDLLKSKRTRDIFRELLLKQVLISNFNTATISGCNLTSVEFELGCGEGFYPFGALINHSCAPNIITVSYNRKLCLIVCRPIKAGEQLFVDYGGNHHFLKERITRQENLLRYYMLRCSCEACEGDYPHEQNLSPRVVNTNFWMPFIVEAPQLLALDVEIAHSAFERYCAILKTLEQIYPCSEIYIMQSLLKKCTFILKRSPVQISIMKRSPPREKSRRGLSLIESVRQFVMNH